MLIKEFVKYEQALALKELGFDEPCLGYFDCERDFKFIFNKQKFLSCEVVTPTYRTAFRWFRDKHEIDVFYWRNSLTDKYRVIDIKISNKEINLEEKFEDTEYTTYEEAEFQCIQQLIKIVKAKEITLKCN